MGLGGLAGCDIACNCSTGVRTRSVHPLDPFLAREFAMATKRKFNTDAFEAIHSAASDLYEAGVIDKVAMKGFDASCLVPSELSPGAIKKLRTATCMGD